MNSAGKVNWRILAIWLGGAVTACVLEESIFYHDNKTCVERDCHW